MEFQNDEPAHAVRVAGLFALRYFLSARADFESVHLFAHEEARVSQSSERNQAGELVEIRRILRKPNTRREKKPVPKGIISFLPLPHQF